MFNILTDFKDELGQISPGFAKHDFTPSFSYPFFLFASTPL